MHPLPVVLVGWLLFSAPAPAAAQPLECTYDEQSKTATLTADYVEKRIHFELWVEAGSLVYQVGEVPARRRRTERGEPCGSATTSNTDLVRVQGSSDIHLFVFLDGGRLEPGATEEPTGVSEIEVELHSRGTAQVGYPQVGAPVRVGTVGVNLNGDDDVDVIFSPSTRAFTYAGSPDPDDIAATGGMGTGGPATVPFTARGGGRMDLLVAGNGPASFTGDSDHDVLIGGPTDDVLSGDSGDDRILGGEGRDLLYGVEWSDVLRGGPGKDVLDGGTGSDRCFGGPGRDRVKSCEAPS